MQEIFSVVKFYAMMMLHRAVPRLCRKGESMSMQVIGGGDLNGGIAACEELHDLAIQVVTACRLARLDLKFTHIRAFIQRLVCIAAPLWD